MWSDELEPVADALAAALGFTEADADAALAACATARVLAEHPFAYAVAIGTRGGAVVELDLARGGVADAQ